MKKLMRAFCLMLALATVLCGCGAKDSDEDIRQDNKVTEPAVTEPAPAAAMTEEELASMLQGSGRVLLGADLELTKEIFVNGTVLDGGNHTVAGPEVKQEEVDGEMKNVVETENGVTVAGGTLENIVVKGKYRTVGDRKGAGANSDVRLKNVVVDGGKSYAINFGYGNGQASLYADDCTLNGWSSYTKFQQAIFTNCTFGWSADGSQGTLRPYINTTLVGCRFEGKTEADGTVTPFNISFKSGIDGVVLTLEDCYVGDTLITQENISTLLNVSAQGNVVRVQNSQ